MGARAWRLIVVANAACASGGHAAPSTIVPGETPGCPRVASIHCRGRLDPAGSGAALVTCRAPAAASDEILVLWRTRARDPFRPAPVERISPCEVRASLGPEEAEEMYVAVVAASGEVLLESRAVSVTSLGQIAAAPRHGAEDGRSRDRPGPAVAGEMPLGAAGPHEERYAGWVILVDLASLATVPFVVGALGALVAAPLVHAIHGNGQAAGKSLLLRVTIPTAVIVGSALAFRAASDCESNLEDGCFGEWIGALVLGGACRWSP